VAAIWPQLFVQKCDATALKKRCPVLAGTPFQGDARRPSRQQLFGADRSWRPPRTFPAGTASKYEGASRARAIYQSLVANGWEVTLTKFKRAMAPRKTDVTIGEFLSELHALHASRAKTIEKYAVSLRMIAAWIADLPEGIRGGSSESRRTRREQIDALRLSIFTPGKIQKWKEAFLVRAGNDPVKQRAARVSANSFIRQARSLFSPKYLEGLETIVMPDPLPFAGVKLERRSMPRYQSSFDVLGLIRSAVNELAESRREEFKTFVLAVMAGLRKNEIDKLEWGSFNWAAGRINITSTQFFHPKSEDSKRAVWIPPQMLEVFRGYHAHAMGKFVIESRVRPIMGTHYSHYRCQATFKRLIAWLRAKGVDGEKPLHALRKEFGSLIAQRFGLYAAKEALGHADVATTAAHYLEVKEKPMIGLGHLLLPAPPES
jgi:integrase